MLEALTTLSLALVFSPPARRTSMALVASCITLCMAPSLVRSIRPLDSLSNANWSMQANSKTFYSVLKLLLTPFWGRSVQHKVTSSAAHQTTRTRLTRTRTVARRRIYMRPANYLGLRRRLHAFWVQTENVLQTLIHMVMRTPCQTGGVTQLWQQLKAILSREYFYKELCMHVVVLFCT